MSATSESAWNGPSCPACRGRGVIAYTNRSRWITTRCEDCHGTGHEADDPPEQTRPDGTLYDPEAHGCLLCQGAGTIMSGRVPCPGCAT